MKVKLIEIINFSMDKNVKAQKIFLIHLKTKIKI